MELLLTLCGALLFVIGAITLKCGRRGRVFLWLAVACFVVAIVVAVLRLLSGVNFPI